MKKLAVFAIAVSLSGLLASGEEAQPINLDLGTNIVKSPVATKGLYGNRSQSAQHARATDTAVVKALRYFKQTQNPDGSWGDKVDQNLATPLVLLSFLGRGEKATSQEFSNTVINARTWLLNATPSETASRITTVISLSEYCALSYLESQSAQKVNEVAKMQTLLNQISPTNNDIWFDFAAFSTMPVDVPKPAWVQSRKEAQEKHLNASTNLSPSTVEEYLNTYLTARATFYQGGQRWHDFNRAVTPELVKRQESDGSFPVSGGQCRFVATALATLRLEIRSQYEPQSSGRPKAKQQKTADEEIRVDVK